MIWALRLRAVQAVCESGLSIRKACGVLGLRYRSILRARNKLKKVTGQKVVTWVPLLMRDGTNGTNTELSDAGGH